MSVAFAPHRQRGKGDITPAGIQKVIYLLARLRMEAIASGCVSRWANHSCGVSTSLAVNSTETIVPVKSALNMNISEVGTAYVDNGP